MLREYHLNLKKKKGNSIWVRKSRSGRCVGAISQLSWQVMGSTWGTRRVPQWRDNRGGSPGRGPISLEAIWQGKHTMFMDWQESGVR